MNEHFAQRIKLLRSSTKLSGESFGKLFNVKKNTISNWEKGSTPTIETLNMIADYFNVSVDYLLGNSDVSKNDNLDRVINLSELNDSQYSAILMIIEEFNKANKR